MYYLAITECPHVSSEARISKAHALLLMHRCPVAKERFPVEEANKKLRKKKTKKKDEKHAAGKENDSFHKLYNKEINADVEMETMD